MANDKVDAADFLAGGGDLESALDGAVPMGTLGERHGADAERGRAALAAAMRTIDAGQLTGEERAAVRRSLAHAETVRALAWLATLAPAEWERGLVHLASAPGFGGAARDIRRAVAADVAELAAQTRMNARRKDAIARSRAVRPGEAVREWPLEGMALERMTDLGNARRFVLAYGADVRRCEPFPFGGWLRWTGSRWVHDETGASMRLAKRVPRLIRAEAPRAAQEAQEAAVARVADGADGDPGKAADRAYAERLEWADASEHVSRLAAILTVAGTEPEVVVERERFDRDPLTLNTPTGTLDLARGQVRACDRADLLMHETGVGYDAAATCPRWAAFVAEIMDGNAEMVAYLQRVAGYCLLGEIREPAFFIFWGGGRNGKGTFVERLRKVMGTYAANTPTSTFVGRKDGGIPNDLAALAGKRLVTMSESEDGERLETALVKQVTGKDPITARFMRGEFFEFFPVFTPILSTNDKPAIRGVDVALRARLHLVPFTVSFAGREDFGLADALDRELAGILNWCLDGFAAYREVGLAKPKIVADAVEEYMAEMDLIGRFLADRCKILSPIEVENGKGADNSALYESFREWCIDGGERVKSQRWLTQELKDRRFVQVLGDRRTWPGLGLAVAARTPHADAPGRR